jgi:hypothetical protein
MENDRRGRYIKFRHRGTTQRVTLDQLHEWFHFHSSPHVDELTYIGDIIKEDVFQFITRREIGRHEEFKFKLIIHLILRCIQKINGHMLYAKGESII